jgi:outer membrane lipoprotein-sorting protein
MIRLIHKLCLLGVVGVIVLGQCVWVFGNSSQQVKGDETAFVDDPNARALYDKMIETMRSAKSLSYTSAYQWESSKSGVLGQCTYKAWLQKPNHFRIETTRRNGDKGGTLIGDGKDLWIFWDGNRPHFSSEEREAYLKTCSNVYMRERTPLARHSIGHKTSVLGAGMSMPVLDPSTFHGYTDSLQRGIEGVRYHFLSPSLRSQIEAG